MASRVFSKINSNIFRNYQTSNSKFLQYCNVHNNGPLFATKIANSPNTSLVSNVLKSTQGNSLFAPDVLKPFNFGPVVAQARFYAEKCDNKKKGGKKECKKERCKKIKLCYCEPSKFKTCRLTVKPVVCKKKLAPYPSFSESCYEEPYNKPSECKMCPWSKKDNPSFKGDIVMKKFHTWNPRIPNIIENNILNLEKVEENLTAQATLAPAVPNANIDGLLPEEGILAKDNSCVRKKGKCTKFPYKQTKYEIGSKKEKKDPCAKPKCVKKKRKLIKDCPKKKQCSGHDGVPLEAAYDIPLENPDLPQAAGYSLKKKQPCNEKGGKHKTCEIDDCNKRKPCAKKVRPPLVCPSEPLVRPSGYKRKPKKGGKGKKCDGIEEELPLICTAEVGVKNETMQPQLHKEF